MENKKVFHCFMAIIMLFVLLTITPINMYATIVDSKINNKNICSDETDIILNDTTGIPDTNLYHAILKEVDDNSDGILTISEAEELCELHAEGSCIKDLTGIECCKNLEYLKS